MNILHIHQDFPDGLPLPHTMAVANLLSELESIDNNVNNVVLSVNRTLNPFKQSFKPFEHGYRVIFFSVPLPFIHQLCLWLCCSWVANKFKGKNIDLIHGHKLTTEGVMARYLSKKIKCAYVISIRGGTDLHMIKRFSGYSSVFKKVFYGAKDIFWVSPWAAKKIAKMGWSLPDSIKNLPNICNIDHGLLPNCATSNSPYVTVLSFQQYKRKGILELANAISSLRKVGKEIHLDVYGTGNTEIVDLVKNHVANLKCDDLIKFHGRIDNNKLISKIRDSKGLLLPSRNETFGMVYVESLSVGTPVLYHQQTGIDGYDIPGIGLEILDERKLTSALQLFEDNYSELKNEAIKFVQDGGLDQFRATNIASTYLGYIKEATCK